jgi:hypothetical protein
MKIIKSELGLIKNIFFIYLILSPAVTFAQQSIECEIMKKSIMDQINAPDKCQSLNQQCLANARYAPNYAIAQSQCGIQLGSCQLGGAIGNAIGGQQQLQEKIQQYKSICER